MYSLVSFNIFVASLGFSVNRDNFTPFFPMQMLLISFSCLMTLASTCSIMLNASGKSGYPCLFLLLEVLRFSALCMMLTIISFNFTILVCVCVYVYVCDVWYVHVCMHSLVCGYVCV